MAQLFLDGLHWIGGAPLALVLTAVDFYLTLRSGFLPLRRFGAAFRMTLGTLFKRRAERPREGDLSPFQALTMALADSLNVMMAIPNLVGLACFKWPCAEAKPPILAALTGTSSGLFSSLQKVFISYKANKLL